MPRLRSNVDLGGGDEPEQIQPRVHKKSSPSGKQEEIGQSWCAAVCPLTGETLGTLERQTETATTEKEEVSSKASTDGTKEKASEAVTGPAEIATKAYYVIKLRILKLI